MKVIYTHCWKLDKTVCRKVKRMWCHPSLPNTFGIFLQVLFFPPLLVRIFFAFTELRFNIKFNRELGPPRECVEIIGTCFKDRAVESVTEWSAPRPRWRPGRRAGQRHWAPHSVPRLRQPRGGDAARAVMAAQAAGSTLSTLGLPQVDQGATNHED